MMNMNLFKRKRDLAPPPAPAVMSVDDDDLFPSTGKNDDEEEEEDLQLLEGIQAMDSSLTDTTSSKPFDDKGKAVVLSHPLKIYDSWKKTLAGSEYEAGGCFSSVCVICQNHAPSGTLVPGNKACGHSFCEGCIGNYLGETIQEDIHRVKCPEKDCKEVLSRRVCRRIVPEEVFERWDSALREASALADISQVKCPYEDCSAVFAHDLRRRSYWDTRPFCHRCRRFSSGRGMGHGGQQPIVLDLD